MVLNYKATNIARAERNYNENFFSIMNSFNEGTPSMLNTLFILEAGGLTEQEASDLVDNKGLVGAYKLSVEGLMNSGFLGNGQEAKAAKKEAQKALETIDETLQNTGETAKS